MKRILQILSVALCLVSGLGLSACGEKKPNPPDPGKDTVKFSDLWTEGASHSFGESGAEFTLDVGAAVGENNYLKLNFESACNLDATMVFVNPERDSEIYSERFYLSAGQTEFRQILDYFHKNKFDKKLERITFRCVGSKTGTFRLNRISAAVHPIDFSKVNFFNKTDLEPQMQVYIEGESVKLGVTLKSGGAVNYLSSIGQGVSQAVVGGNVEVGQSLPSGGEGSYSDDVNLINAHDTGRLIQQSFYGTKGDSLAEPKDDYVCGYFNHDGNPATPDAAWPYNPVQGGDQFQNFSQLVDVQAEKDSIYIKTRPMDWAKSGSVTPFYMENFYAIREDKTFGDYVEVKNTSTDFSGYRHDNVRDQELPAFYGITPLHTLISYTGTRPWTEESATVKQDLGFWSPQTPETRFESSENWIAWVNSDKWGIGLYVPDVTTMLAGRNDFSVSVDRIGYFPYAAVPCTYTAPLGRFSLQTYESFSYTYYLKLDHVDTSRAFFANLHENGASNPELLALEGRG